MNSLWPYRTSRRLQIWVASSAAGVACLWLVFREADPLNALKLAQQIPTPAILLAVALNLTGLYLQASCWSFLLKEQHLQAQKLFHYELAAQCAAAITPEGVGEFLRIVWLRQEQVRSLLVAALIAVKKYLSCLGLVPFAIVVVFSGFLPGWVRLLAVMYVTATVAVGFGCAALSNVPNSPPPESGRPGVGRLWQTLLDKFAVFRFSLPGGVRILVIAALCLLVRLSDFLAAWLICVEIGIPGGVVTPMMACLLIEVSNLLPNAPAQLGTFGLAATTATAIVGASEDLGLAFAMLFHAQQLLPQVILGFFPMVTATRLREMDL